MTRTVHVKGFHRKDGIYVRPHTKTIRGPARKSKVPQRTVFFPSESKKYADMVDLTSVENAKVSVFDLLSEFSEAKTYVKKLRVKRVTVLAANRAKVMSQNPRLKHNTRLQKARVAEVYEKAAKRMKFN